MSKLRGLLWRLGVLVVVLWWAFTGGPLLAVGEWLIFGYLCWRAAPAVRSDIARASSLVKGHGRLAGEKAQGRL